MLIQGEANREREVEEHCSKRWILKAIEETPTLSTNTTDDIPSYVH